MRPSPVALLLLGLSTASACGEGGQPQATAPAPNPVEGIDLIELDGMMRVPAGSVRLGPVRGARGGQASQGPRRPGGPTAKGVGGAPGGPGGGGAPGGGGGHGGGGVPGGGSAPAAERQAGGPPALGASARRQRRQAEPVAWELTSGEDYPSRMARVSEFWMDRTEVTRAEYREFLVATGYRPPSVEEDWAADAFSWDGVEPPEGTDDHPVVLVSWYDARAYCAWADKRLPTEAEWQLAALGPASLERTYPWGDSYEPARLNHGRLDGDNFDDSDGYRLTSPVGAFPGGRSPYGLEDAFGNAWEFTADWRTDGWQLYESDGDEALGGPGGASAPLVDPRSEGPGLYVAVRGGSYFFDVSAHPQGERHDFLPEIRRKTSGFRCVRDA